MGRSKYRPLHRNGMDYYLISGHYEWMKAIDLSILGSANGIDVPSLVQVLAFVLMSHLPVYQSTALRPGLAKLWPHDTAAETSKIGPMKNNQY